MLALSLLCIALPNYTEARSAMDELDVPSFTISNETVLTGDEPEFHQCKSFQAKYFASISARPEMAVYSYSEAWGYVIRTLYIIGDAVPIQSRSTMICWRPKDLDEIKFAVGVRGAATDLERKSP